MYNRKDVQVLNEPWLIEQNPEANEINFLDFDGNRSKFTNVITKIQSMEGNRPITWVKEHGYVYGNFEAGPEILDFFAPNAKFIFLLRDPLHSYVSFHKVIQDTVDDTFPADWRQNEIWLSGIENLMKTFLQCQVSFLVILTDKLLDDTEGELKRMCAYCEIPFDQRMLTWDPIKETDSSPFTGDWYKWFKAICASTGFQKETKSENSLHQYVAKNFNAEQKKDLVESTKKFIEIKKMLNIK
jgi:hypothetical protein